MSLQVWAHTTSTGLNKLVLELAAKYTSHLLPLLILLRILVFSVMDRNVNRRTSLLLPHKEITLVTKLPISAESEI